MEGKRKYLVRVTRHPLTDEDIDMLRAAGTLPADHADRSAPATDFVEVAANGDEEAMELAAGKTRLEVRGEKLSFHEVNGPHLRDLEIDDA